MITYFQKCHENALIEDRTCKVIYLQNVDFEKNETEAVLWKKSKIFKICLGESKRSTFTHLIIFSFLKNTNAVLLQCVTKKKTGYHRLSRWYFPHWDFPLQDVVKGDISLQGSKGWLLRYSACHFFSDHALCRLHKYHPVPGLPSDNEKNPCTCLKSNSYTPKKSVGR